MSPAASRRQRVLHLGPDVPGGMITVMRGLLASPLADRYELEFVATHRGAGALRRLGVFVAALAQLCWWSLRRRGRVVHIHATVRGSMYRKAVCVLLADALGRRVVLHVHSGPGDVASFRAGMSRRRAVALRLALRRADAVLSVSAASRAALEGAFGIGAIEVVPNAAPPVAPQLGARRRDGAGAAVFFGGFANPVKGGAEMLAAMRLLPAGEPPLLLAGPGDLPEDGRELLARRPGDRWLGWIEGEERERLLQSASIFVLASTSEGLPMALLEAMSRGLAIVATEVGGVPDVVGDGVEALLVAPGEPAALAAALSRLAGNPELAERLGTAARDRAAAMGPERVADELDAIYRRLIAA